MYRKFLFKTRKAIFKILRGINPRVLQQFKNNPEEFLSRATNLVNEQKATVIIEHIAYKKLDSTYDTSIFTEPSLKGRLSVNAMPAKKHLYDYVVYDSENEKNFASALETAKEVVVYVKLPHGFFINTPIGKYTPDWAIVFHNAGVKHVYFVAETKGSLCSLELRPIEQAKIHCAREHFKAISSPAVRYDVVDSFKELMGKVLA